MDAWIFMYISSSFEGSEAVCFPLTNFNGESAAIYQAVGNLEDMASTQKVVFLIDCQAVIFALSSSQDLVAALHSLHGHSDQSHEFWGPQLQ